MPAKRCSVCSLNYPVTKDYTVCLACGEPTEFVGTARAMHPDELARLRQEHTTTIPTILPDLTATERDEWDRDWAAVAEERIRRGALWSHADLLAEFTRRDHFRRTTA